MQDNMIDMLGTLRDTGAQVPADSDTVAADVARGRRALIVRRGRRIAGTGFVAVAATAAIATGTVGQSSGSGATAASAAPAASRPSAVIQPTTATTQLQLIAYEGAQPVGFKVSTVPAGWHVTSSSRFAFVAVPPGTKTPPRPAGAPVSIMGGIAVMLQGDSRLPADEPISKVTVQGNEGQLGLTKDKSAKWLIYPHGAGSKVLVQVPTKLGLTDKQIVQFADGITVTSDAQAGRG
jgi:hypothetical protein